VKRLITETGAGQWGSSLAFAGALYGLEVQVFMVRVFVQPEPYRRALMETYGARCVASPSNEDRVGRAILARDPNHPGSLGIAISEAVEVAVQRDDTKYALGSVLNHVLLHQTVLGLEAMAQLEMANDYPDVIVGCTGGGFQFRRHRVSVPGRSAARRPQGCASSPSNRPRARAHPRHLCVRFRRHPHLTPLTKMHTLGSKTFTPPGFHAGGLRYHGMAPLVSHVKATGADRGEGVSPDQLLWRRACSSRGPKASCRPRKRITLCRALSTRRSAAARRASRAQSCSIFAVTAPFDMQAYIDYFAGQLEDRDYDERELAMALSGLRRCRAGLSAGVPGSAGPKEQRPLRGRCPFHVGDPCYGAVRLLDRVGKDAGVGSAWSAAPYTSTLCRSEVGEGDLRRLARGGRLGDQQ